MKTLKSAVLALFAGLICFSANAQGGVYGKTPEDSINCLLNRQTYTTEYKSNNYEAALLPWRIMYEECPRASQNFYIHGVEMMRYLIKKSTDPALKEGRIDTLLLLYDRRMEYFDNNDKADLLSKKANDIQTYRPNDNKAICETYMKALSVNKDIDLTVALKVMLISSKRFEKNEITLEEFTDIYTKMAEIAEYQLKSAPEDTVKLQDKNGIESVFLNSDAANCDNLIKILGNKFNANKTDSEVVKLVVYLLTEKECTESELYYESVETYNRLNPSPSASYSLARMYYSKGDKAKAETYFKEAVERETVAAQKSKYYQEFGSLYMKEKDLNKAINCARQAIAAYPRNGKAYFLLGTAYGQVKCNDEDLKGSIYWVAVDQFMKAKQLDASLSNEANKSIGMFSQHFPLNADAFFLNVLDGTEYTVKCGPVNEKTIVRTRK